MLFIAFLDIVVVSTLLLVTTRKGLAAALPYFTFFVITIPDQSQFDLGGLFDLTTRRLAIVILLVLYLLHPEKTPREKTPLKYLMLSSIAVTGISTAMSLQFTTSLKQLLAQCVEYYIVYYIVVHVVSSIETLRKIATAFVAAIAVCCVFGIAEIYLHWSVISLFPSQFWDTYTAAHSAIYVAQDRGLRVKSTFPHPILFGDAIAMTLPVALYLLGTRQARFRKHFAWLAVLLMVWNLYKTGSRGSWLAAAIALFLSFFFMQGRVKRFISVCVLLAASVVAVRPGVWESLSNMYIATFDPNNPLGMSYDYRFALAGAIQDANQASPERWLFGYGLGTFRTVGLIVNFRDTQHTTSYRWYTCDSSWLLFLYEIGYAGLAVMALLLGKAGRVALRGSLNKSNPYRTLSAALLISMLSFYFSMFSVAAYAWGQPGQMLWILIALAVCCERLRRRSRTSSRPQDSSLLVQAHQQMALAGR